VSSKLHVLLTGLNMKNPTHAHEHAKIEWLLAINASIMSEAFDWHLQAKK
jgi:hypothetical protein